MMMKQFSMLIVLVLCMFMVGCAALDATIPVNPETGYREATELTKDVTSAVPYGSSALAVLLFASNALIFVRKKKTEAGFMATIRAIEAASKDPEMKEMVAKLKLQLAEAHKGVNAQPLVNRILSKIKFG